MKLEKAIIEKIQNIAQVAQLVGIDSVIIERELVRAIDDEKTVLIFHGENIDIPFDAIALNRLSTFASRLELAKAGDSFEIEAITDDSKEYVKSLTMKNKKSKIDYRCANPAVIKAPRQIQDTMKYEILLNAQDTATLTKGAAAMGADTVGISASSDEAFFVMSDLNKDEFKLDISGSVSVAKGVKSKDISFSHKYPSKVLMSLFKKTPDGKFQIGGNGLLNIEIQGVNLFVLPQV